MYEDATTAVKVNGRVSKSFLFRVGVHQGSVLSPLLFIIVLEALSREFRGGLPMELLYADDLVLLADSMKELIEKIKIWRAVLEEKGLRINLCNTKISQVNFLVESVDRGLVQIRSSVHRAWRGFTKSVVLLRGYFRRCWC